MTETAKTSAQGGPALGGGASLDELFNIGAHFGFGRSRRHPSVAPFLFCSKNRTDIFDLEKTETALERAKDFVSKMAESGANILFVGGKNEAQNAVKEAAEQAGQPYVASRWIGGTLTNFGEIRKRIEIMIDLISQKEKGELMKFTKKERLLIDRKIEKLQNMFGGIKDMTAMPKALFVIDPRFEDTALREAKSLNIPVVALCGSDNNISEIDYPIPANDSNIASIKFFAEKIAEAYNKGKK